MEKIRKNFFLYTVIFLIGGSLYSTIEIIYRQYTHISMFFSGGLCLVLITIIDLITPRAKFLIKMLICGVAITLTELICGIFFNIFLGLEIWNYNNEPFNFLGQICPGFSLMWILISIPGLLVSRVLVLLLTNEKTTP